MPDTPTVSIGLPVHNGAAFVAEAIESILAQTFADFELVISDNASTDRTPEICRGYAAADRRIRFYRQETNIGAAPNFNLVFHRSSGKYFKWAAHDDLIRPTYLERCVAALEAQPDAVLCQPIVEIVDGAGAREIYDHGAFGTGASRQSDRLAARLRARRCTEVFGVIRRAALCGTALIGDHVGADRTLLLELALRGRFLTIPEILFVNRDHPARFTRRHRTLHAQAAWYAAAGGSQRRVLRTWILYAICLDLVRRGVAAAAERRRCYLRMAQSIAYRRRWFRLVMEPIEAVAPRAAAVEPWVFDTGARLKSALRRSIASALAKARVGEAGPPRPDLPS
jgi:glycosyltransferase involved in cell wall biosynthesis